MIDFRYHLISIIAVLLALAIGILAGSGFLGGPVLSDLRHRLNNIATDNSGLQKDVATLRKTTQQNQVFAQATEPWLVQTALAGSAIVLLEPQGTDTAASNNIVSAIATAGGTVRSTITFTDKLALADPTSVNQLALTIHSTSGAGRKLRDQAAMLLGERAAAAASRSLSVDTGKPSEDALRFDDLLNQLERNGFITRDQSQSGMAAAPGTLFVVLAGSVDHPPFPATDFCLTLARSLAAHSAVVLAAEPSTSTWNFVSTVRSDARAQKTVATVDNADTVPGGIAAVLGLREAIRGRIGNYGFGPGADAVIPQPAVSPS